MLRSFLAEGMGFGAEAFRLVSKILRVGFWGSFRLGAIHEFGG